MDELTGAWTCWFRAFSKLWSRTLKKRFCSITCTFLRPTWIPNRWLKAWAQWRHQNSAFFAFARTGDRALQWIVAFNILTFRFGKNFSRVDQIVWFSLIQNWWSWFKWKVFSASDHNLQRAWKMFWTSETIDFEKLHSQFKKHKTTWKVLTESFFIFFLSIKSNKTQTLHLYIFAEQSLTNLRKWNNNHD